MIADRRSQTTLDFTIGITIFLVTLSAVFLFVPGALQPFTEGSQENIVTVNRVADTLGEDTLANPNAPYIFDTACTVAYFEDPTAPPAGCDFSGSDLRATIGLADTRNVNMTIRGNVSSGGGSDKILCWDDNADSLVEETASDCDPTTSDVVFELGEPAPGGSQSSVTARRVVEVDGTDVFLVVKIW